MLAFDEDPSNIGFWEYTVYKVRFRRNQANSFYLACCFCWLTSELAFGVFCVAVCNGAVYWRCGVCWYLLHPKDKYFGFDVPHVCREHVGEGGVKRTIGAK